MLLEILLAVLIGLLHYYSLNFLIHKQKIYAHIVSFSAGVSITYLFIELFPKFATGVEELSKLLYIFVLLGFVTVHLFEKFIHNQKNRRTRKKEISIEHFIISFFYHTVIGIAIVQFLAISYAKTFLLIVPILLYTIISAVNINTRKNHIWQIILASSTLLGVAIALTTPIHPFVYHMLLGTIIGILSYIIIRHSIPQYNTGKATSLLLGITLYMITIMLTW